MICLGRPADDGLNEIWRVATGLQSGLYDVGVLERAPGRVFRCLNDKGGPCE